MRECLGWWDEPAEDTAAAIDLVTWIERQNDAARTPSQAGLVLDVRPDRSAATIALGAQGSKGRTLLITHTQPGTAWVVDKLRDLIDNRDIVEVALHPSSQAGALIPALTKAGIDFEPITTAQVGAACGWIQEGVKNAEIEDLGQADLDAAVPNAATRTRGEVELFAPINPSINIGPLIAASVAGYRWANGDGATSDDSEGFVW